jgi:hypothetical protein
MQKTMLVYGSEIRAYLPAALFVGAKASFYWNPVLSDVYFQSWLPLDYIEVHNREAFNITVALDGKWSLAVYPNQIRIIKKYPFRNIEIATTNVGGLTLGNSTIFIARMGIDADDYARSQFLKDNGKWDNVLLD